MTARAAPAKPLANAKVFATAKAELKTGRLVWPAAEPLFAIIPVLVLIMAVAAPLRLNAWAAIKPAIAVQSIPAKPIVMA